MTSEEKEMMMKLSDRARDAFYRATNLEQDSKSPEDDPKVEEAYQEYKFLNMIRNNLQCYFDFRKSVQIIISLTEDKAESPQTLNEE